MSGPRRCPFGACTPSRSWACDRVRVFVVEDVALAVGVYFARMFVITAAYHRYFLAPVVQDVALVPALVLALGAQSAAQKGVIWWASHHRWHHRHSDMEKDVHSVEQRGFCAAHIGWIMRPDWNDTDDSGVADLAKLPRAALLEPTVDRDAAHGRARARVSFSSAARTRSCGVTSCRRCCCGTDRSRSISLAHLFGRQRYATGDASRNNWLLAVLTTGGRAGAQQPPPLSELGAAGDFGGGRSTSPTMPCACSRSRGSSGICASRRWHVVDAPAPGEVSEEISARAA